MAHGLDDVAGPRLALGPDQGRPLGDATQGLTQVGGTAHEGDTKGPLVDVVCLVGGRQHFALVDVVDTQGLEDLRLGEVADPSLGHDRDRHGALDRLDQGRVTHAGHAALGPDVGRHALESHHRHCAGILGDASVLGGDHVHDDPAPQHVGQTALDGEGPGLAGAGGLGGRRLRSRRRGPASLRCRCGRCGGRVLHGVSLLPEGGRLSGPYGACSVLTIRRAPPRAGPARRALRRRSSA